jgi:tyrosyl-tRNA synthetase
MNHAEYIPKSQFLNIITKRGYFHQCTNLQGLDEVMLFHEQAEKPLVAYIGFDCTAPSLHVGSLMQIMVLRWLQKCGHKPIVLMGGFTTKIGDPSGKDKSRPPITDEQIAINKAGITKVFSKFLEFEEEFDATTTNAVIVDNSDWLSTMSLKWFLSKIASYFSVNEMIKMDSVSQRLERESFLSYLEFSYSVLQGFDFVQLFQKHYCRLQIGGSDQWGNIIQGVNFNRSRIREALAREVLKAKEEGNVEKYTEYLQEVVPVGIGKTPEDAEKDYQRKKTEWEQEYGIFGLTTPLLTTASGAKMGKTADGAVWLNPDMLSPFDYWQFWRNTEDADVGRFLKLFTELPLDEIAALEALQGAEINEAKKILATEATALLHGRDAALAAAEAARKTFEEGAISSNLPTVSLSIGEHGAELPAFKLFHISGLCNSGSEARKLIQGGGARINDASLASETQIVSLADYRTQPLKLSLGKKKHILVKVRD